ncbi:dTDP-4-dehydrorhamnose reductase [Acerihabitans sp. KWT182]|uniref:dTDP-4-dehydrorhamnose reductase n=1 Tax=Acerihabitans sp. KWT182 TaxID=3157919 RepID=A0AAU7Q5X3_9GAMM
MKILLTGANGQLGRCFQDRLPTGWQLQATDSDTLDITDFEEVIRFVKECMPDAIVNAAAYTAVDKAESDITITERVNITGPKNLAIAAKSINKKFIHVSTDYVFDGNSEEPYIETDPTNPLSVYGVTKLKGEQAVLDNLEHAIIIRTAWVFSEYGKNFVKTMIRLANERNKLDIVNDQFGCPTYAGDLAEAIITLLKLQVTGIYHYCGNEAVSWCQFAETIFEKAFENHLISHIPSITGITTEQYPTPAKRPKYSILSCKKITDLGIKTSDWNEQLNRVIYKIVN